MIRTHRNRLVVDLLHDWGDERGTERIRIRVPEGERPKAFERTILAQLAAGNDPRNTVARAAALQARIATLQQAQERSGIVPHDAAPTIAEYVPRYLRELAARGRKPATIEASDKHLRCWIVPCLGLVPVHAVRTADFTALRLKITDAGRSPKTINNVLTTLSALVRHWWREQDVTPPAFQVGLVRVHKDKRATFYTEPELERLLEHADKGGPDARALILLGCDAGLRLSECRALHWTDIDDRAVTVERTREGDQEYPPKGWRSRVVPCTPRLAAALQGLARDLRDPHVFLDRTARLRGVPLTRKTLRMRFEKVQIAAGVTHGSFHTLRHTFCTRLAMAGVPARTIQELAGHADLVTAQRYMHAAPGATDEAIKKLG